MSRKRLSDQHVARTVRFEEKHLEILRKWSLKKRTSETEIIRWALEVAANEWEQQEKE